MYSSSTHRSNDNRRPIHYRGIHSFGRPNRPIDPISYFSVDYHLDTPKKPITTEYTSPNGYTVQQQLLHDEHVYAIQYTVLISSSRRYEKLTEAIKTANAKIPHPPCGNFYTNTIGTIRELSVDVTSAVMGQSADSEDKKVCFVYRYAKTKKGCDEVSDLLSHHNIRFEDFAALQAFDDINKGRLYAFFQSLCANFI